MTGTEEKCSDLKELKVKRASLKGRLTTFEKYLSDLQKHSSISSVQYNEMKARLKRCESMYDEYDLVQMNIEIKTNNHADEILERESTEDRYFRAIAEAQEIICNYKENDSESEVSHATVTNTNFKLPQIQIPKFDGASAKWLEFHDTYVSMIHTNTTIPTVNKYHYLKSSLMGEAASVIASLEISNRNYEVAWKLLCDRYNDKRKLVNIHLKSLFEVEDIKEDSSLRSLADHIAKHLRALNTLDEKTENWDTLIIFLFVSKLDTNTSTKWEEHKNTLKQKPTLQIFYEFLRKRADVIEATTSIKTISDKDSKSEEVQTQNSKIQPTIQGQHYKRINKQQKSFVAVSYDNNSKRSKCLACNSDHLIYYCEKFLSMSPADRYTLITKNKHCVNCLRSGHMAPQCKSRPCRVCSGSHNSLLHQNKENKQVVSTPVALSTCISNQVLLSTAIIDIITDTNDRIEARCLLDCGSQSSFISRDLKDKLKIKCQDVNSVCVTGINNVTFEAIQRCSFKIQSHTNKFSMSINAFIINEITSTLPSHEVDMSQLKLPSNITLADPQFYIPSKIDVLLGADLFWDLVSMEQIKLGKNKPMLQNSKLGWLVAGPVMCCSDTSIESKIVCNFTQNIQKQLNKFWQLEEVPMEPVMSPEEEACEQHFVQHTRRLENGRFCVTLPLKGQPEQLGDTYSIARKRFESLERRFQRQPNVKAQYVNFLEEYEDLGHLSRIERPEKAVFLPHHPVLKERSESTRCRVVFDASCKSNRGLSLNDIMMVGPTVQDDIFSILTRLREHTFIFTGDIEKMYRQILVEPIQRHLQMILWRKDESEPISYLQLNTVTYGTSSAPFLSTRCLVQLAMECEEPLIKSIMLHDFYVDDLITGYSNEQDLNNIYQRITKHLRSAGFELRKVKSNSKHLLNNITKEINNENKQENLKISSTTNTLGIEWDPNADCILISVAKPTMYGNISKHTKRTILSASSSIFDPLGLLCVSIITCKMILQLLWLQKIGWDDQIPEEISQMWQRFISNLKYIENLSIPRHAICNNAVVIHLHTFSDASMKAYAACVYVRSSDATGHVTVRLLCAKSKVAPLQTSTIPRLELCGSVLASRLCKKVTDSLRCSINEKYFWCDSKVVLGWLNTSPHKLSTFVSHRVAEINKLGANSKWMYVPSALNPADLASRGVYPDEVEHLSLWWEGPTFLKKSQGQWPEQQQDDIQKDLPEIRVQLCNVDTPQTSIIEFKKYSSFLRLRNTVAYLYRFVNNCQSKGVKQIGPLTVDELQRSELKLAQLSQQESFQKYKNNFEKNPVLFNLTPTVDETGLIRVGGRLDNSSYNLDKKHPILLDSKHHYCELIMRYYHIKLMHAGPQLLLSVIREQYWPIGGRILARKICNQCLICKKLKGAVATQIMGNLPSERVSPGFPFTGTDYAGPFMILNKKGRGARLMKCYLCVFICFKVKAVHLELVSDLTTEAFILALRRFMSRRGKPREIFSDNGTNFVGASREIAALVKDNINSVTDLANEGIKFKFSPAYSPNYGGLYEAAVKSAKFHLKRVVGNVHFTFEELGTLLCQIEAILNSRPLVPMSSDPNDLTPLTPGHFLIGRPLTSLPAPCLEEANPSRLHRYARIEQARQHFWRRWSHEYICELQQRTKWLKRQPNIEPGQLVLIREEANPPLKWPLGRITAVYPGTDGACRVADIKTQKGTVRRSINRICPLLEQ